MSIGAGKSLALANSIHVHYGVYRYLTSHETTLTALGFGESERTRQKCPADAVDPQGEERGDTVERNEFNVGEP